MIKNLEASMQLMERALKTLPDDSDLSEAKAKIKSTLNILEHVQKKRGKKKNEDVTPAQKWQFDLKHGLIFTGVSFKNGKKSLEMIESMIQQEQDKLDAMKKPAKTQSQMLID